MASLLTVSSSKFTIKFFGRMKQRHREIYEIFHTFRGIYAKHYDLTRQNFSRFYSKCLFTWKLTVKNGELAGQTASNISVLLWME